MVVLTDATGTILHSIGDDDFLGAPRKVALRRAPTGRSRPRAPTPSAPR
jgi:hypothetical protein